MRLKSDCFVMDELASITGQLVYIQIVAGCRDGVMVRFVFLFEIGKTIITYLSRVTSNALYVLSI